MTLVLSVHGKNTLWLLADRRLTRRGKVIRDDAIKVLSVNATDGVAVLGYAGLGMTGRGTEPSTWMNAVLRGRAGLTIEHSLGVISDVANRELPRFLRGLGGLPHTVIAPAFVSGVGPRLFTIDNVFDPASGQFGYRFTQIQSPRPGVPPRVAIGGSGAPYLLRTMKEWLRPLLSLVKQHNLGKVSEWAVADRLAQLNYDTHLGVGDGSVGPRSLVVWRHRLDVLRRNQTAAGHQYYLKTEREAGDASFPQLSNGTDMVALIGALYPPWVNAAILSGGSMQFTPAQDEERLRRANELPDTPDERLR